MSRIAWFIFSILIIFSCSKELPVQSVAGKEAGVTVQDWSNIVGDVDEAVYAVLHLYANDTHVAGSRFLGTAFAISEDVLVTNMHVLLALFSIKMLYAESDIKDLGLDGNGYESEIAFVRNGTTTLSYKRNLFFFSHWDGHVDYDIEVQDPEMPDIVAIVISEGSMSSRFSLASKSQALSLRVGQPIGTIGFPGELADQTPAHWFPIATFKSGVVSALRVPSSEKSTSPSRTYIVQHDFDSTSGTSGSPIFTADGRVVAVNNAAIEFNFFGLRIGVGSLGFGTRIDKLLEVLDGTKSMASSSIAKQVPRNREALIKLLDGQPVSVLNVR